jgi:RNA polymerase sigma-70 factor (ECF subfamily)
MDSLKSDEDLVVDILGGIENGFSQLYDRYRRPVYSIAFRIIRNSEEAYDASQEIFIRAYRSLDSFDRRKSRFYSWVCRLAANYAIDCWRVRRRRAETQFPEDSSSHPLGIPALVDAIRSPHGELENKEKVQEIWRCVDALPELQKKVFVLRYFQELKLEEIAEMENCSLGTVKTSLYRATQTIRRAVKRGGGQS